jgi:uncharacterized membrane protein YeaQ/YmgE (transglycosylase-associated protein family)
MHTVRRVEKRAPVRWRVLEELYMSIIAWLVVGAIAGFIASRLVPGDEGYGVIGGLIAGIVGALVGGFLFGLLTGEDWTTGINIGTIVAAIVGAVIVVVIWNAIARRGSTAV